MPCRVGEHGLEDQGRQLLVGGVDDLQTAQLFEHGAHGGNAPADEFAQRNDERRILPHEKVDVAQDEAVLIDHL